jgi:primosomal protein N' (replication factor Y)
MSSTGISSSSIKPLIDKGLLITKRREIIRDSAWYLPENPIITHTEKQKSAIEAIKKAFDRQDFTPFLLYGVTGSGKTEIYLEVISHCLASGRTAAVLVPEIALTPQIASRFRRRFGGQVVVIHSRISQGERYDSWRRLALGKARVVIGARSALFAPLQNPGLIVVDEEHEHSFKQMNRPHYHARDCAIILAQKLNIPIILGSATPSIESFENARRGKYRLLELPERVAGGRFSTFHLVDLTQKEALLPSTAISPLLMDKIEDRLSHGDHIIILQNRRGFSTFLKCRHCKAVETCPNCTLTLTYHITVRRLRCHICGFQKLAPTICSSCGGTELIYCGTGTQKVEEELGRLFPDARIVRMDLDTTAGIDSHFKILEAFQKGKYEILLGTQMVAKGLDFPEVTLVGIISADTELLRPNFRSEEGTFRLLVQAAGRSGRHRPGEVVVQTYNPEHKVFELVRHNDYLGFFEKTVKDRRSLRYPPFSRLIILRISSPAESEAAAAATDLAQTIPRDNYIKILGPTPALIAKVKRKYYYNILLKIGLLSQKQLAEIKKMLIMCREETLKKFKAQKVSIEIDVDPMEIH